MQLLADTSLSLAILLSVPGQLWVRYAGNRPLPKWIGITWAAASIVVAAGAFLSTR